MDFYVIKHTDATYADYRPARADGAHALHSLDPQAASTCCSQATYGNRVVSSACPLREVDTGTPDVPGIGRYALRTACLAADISLHQTAFTPGCLYRSTK